MGHDISFSRMRSNGDNGDVPLFRAITPKDTMGSNQITSGLDIGPDAPFYLGCQLDDGQMKKDKRRDEYLRDQGLTIAF